MSALLICLGVCVNPSAIAQVEPVSGDFSLWTSATGTWTAIAFEDYYGSAFPYLGTGCLSSSGPVTLALGEGEMRLQLPDGLCPVYDGTSAANVGADGRIPPSASLALQFDPPIRGFYASFGSLAVGDQISLRLLDAQGAQQTALTGPASPNATLGSNFGFISEQPVHTVEVSSSELGDALLGYFVGLIASEQSITRPGLVACSSAPCDFAVAYTLHRPSAFLTPTTGTGDLDTWPEVGFETGIAAGDAVCSHWAEQAGYSVPSRFIAFLGDGGTDPLCRVSGLPGTYSLGMCNGLPVSPRMARWWRVDGLAWNAPFLGVAGQLPLRPPLDATGARSHESYFTGFFPDQTCGDWNSTAGGTAYGNPNAVDFGWINAGAVSCALENRLLCVERALGLPFPVESAPGRAVFVSRAHGTGNLLSWPQADASATTGIEAADSICVDEAVAAGLDHAESFRAWLSTDGQDARDRVSQNGPYVRTDGVALAASIDDLLDGEIDSGIARHADAGSALSLAVWTGTASAGTFSGNSCDAWNSTEGQGQAGSTGLADAGWTSVTAGLCNFDRHLYCISDAIGPMFADGFEALVP